MLVRSDQGPPREAACAQNHYQKYVQRCRLHYDDCRRFLPSAITHILPLPESALTRLSGFTSNVMDVLFACGSWVIRLFVD